MTKEEKIKEEYAKHGIEITSPRENGWSILRGNVDSRHFDIKIESCTDIRPNDSTRKIIRPISLRGIEDNNGWNKISEVGHPKSEQYVEVFVGDEIYYDILYRNGSYERCFGSSAETYYENLTPTHWREVDERKPVY